MLVIFKATFEQGHYISLTLTGYRCKTHQNIACSSLVHETDAKGCISGLHISKDEERTALKLEKRGAPEGENIGVRVSKTDSAEYESSSCRRLQENHVATLRQERESYTITTPLQRYEHVRLSPRITPTTGKHGQQRGNTV